MNSLNLQDLACVCRRFMDLSYPGGPGTMPLRKRTYYEIGDDLAIDDLLPPSPKSIGICQDLTRHGDMHGYEFRLGSAHYPHLKLRVQIVHHHDCPTWIYSVDTHDGLFKANQFVDAAEAEAWRRLTEHNRFLKHQIENVLAEAGYMTPVSLLRADLTPTA